MSSVHPPAPVPFLELRCCKCDCVVAYVNADALAQRSKPPFSSAPAQRDELERTLNNYAQGIGVHCRDCADPKPGTVKSSTAPAAVGTGG